MVENRLLIDRLAIDELRVYARIMSEPCYCTFVRGAARKVSALYDEALRPLGINIAQFAILRRIERAGLLSLTELARLSDLDRSTVGRNVKILERMALVQTAAGRDRREAARTLTDAGRCLLKAGVPLWEQGQTAVRQALGPEGVQRLRTLLQTL